MYDFKPGRTSCLYICIYTYLKKVTIYNYFRHKSNKICHCTRLQTQNNIKTVNRLYFFSFFFLIKITKQTYKMGLIILTRCVAMKTQSATQQSDELKVKMMAQRYCICNDKIKNLHKLIPK